MHRISLVLLAVTACAANDDVPPPIIASLSPDHGPPGASVVIAGSHFCHQPQPEDGEEVDPLACRSMGTVEFGVDHASIVTYSDTSLTVEVPQTTPGAVVVSVSVAGTVSNHVNFLVE